MKRKDIASEIVDFCVKHKIFKASGDKKAIKKNIEYRLGECAFIEEVINIIMVTLKTENSKNIDIIKTKNLLLGLEKIRLDLEYKDFGK